MRSTANLSAGDRAGSRRRLEPVALAGRRGELVRTHCASWPRNRRRQRTTPARDRSGIGAPVCAGMPLWIARRTDAHLRLPVSGEYRRRPDHRIELM